MTCGTISDRRTISPAFDKDLGFTSNRSKRPAVLEVSAQKLEALKRTLARGLGKRSQLNHLELLARPRKISTKKSRKIISKFTQTANPRVKEILRHNVLRAEAIGKCQARGLAQVSDELLAGNKRCVTGRTSP